MNTMNKMCSLYTHAHTCSVYFCCVDLLNIALSHNEQQNNNKMCYVVHRSISILEKAIDID